MATLTTLLFAFLSNPASSTVGSFSQVPDASVPFMIICQVVGVQERPNGTTLTVVDSTQSQAKAFLPRELGVPPAVGQIVRLSLACSERAGFYFVEGISYP